MRRIVLPPVAPRTAPAITLWVDLIAIAAADVRIAIEVVIAIDVDVVASPATTPTPAAAPERSHRKTDSE